jgi:hypothetical protein
VILMKIKESSSLYSEEKATMKMKSPKRRTNIFSTTSSKVAPPMDPMVAREPDPAAATSSLQLLSQAASAIPKMKINNPQMPPQTIKTVQNKGNFKIIPTSAMTPGQKLIFKPLDPSMKKPGYTMPKLAMPANKMPTKVQLLVNNQAGTGKPVIITGKSATPQNNVYTIGGDKQKVIVQSIEKFVPFDNGNHSGVMQTPQDPNSEKIVVLKVNHENQYNIIDNQTGSVVPRTPGSEQDFQNSPVITEDTPINILPGSQTTIQATQFPKIQLSGNFLKTSGGTKQIKLLPLFGKNIKIAGINTSKLGNRIQIPTNLLNTKSVTILQQQEPIVTSVETIVQAPVRINADGKAENSTTDSEQELEDVNRVKNVRPGGKSAKTNHPSSGAAGAKAAKKMKVGEEEVDAEKPPNDVEDETQEKSDTSETNNVYDVSNLVIYGEYFTLHFIHRIFYIAFSTLNFFKLLFLHCIFYTVFLHRIFYTAFFSTFFLIGFFTLSFLDPILKFPDQPVNTNENVENIFYSLDNFSEFGGVAAEEKIEYLKSLRYNLEQTRMLCDLVKKREILKLQKMRATEEHILLEMDPLGTDGEYF